MPMGNENEKKEQKINLCVSKDSLLHAFLAGYIRAFAVDLEEDRYELLYEKEEDPVISEIIKSAQSYSAFNRQVSLLLPEPSFSSWREVTGSRENIRSMLKMQESFTFTFPRRGMENWMKIEVKLLEKRDGEPVKILMAQPGPDRSSAGVSVANPQKTAFSREFENYYDVLRRRLEQGKR